MADHLSMLVVSEIHRGQYALPDLAEHCSTISGDHELPLVKGSPYTSGFGSVDLICSPFPPRVNVDAVCTGRGTGYPHSGSDVVPFTPILEDFLDTTSISIGKLFPIIP
jgi:hypothetical protein